MKRHSLAQSQSTFLKFEQEKKIEFISKLSENQTKIIALLDEGYYPAAIARRLKLSRSYVSRFCNELKVRNLITTEWVNPLQSRATSFRLGDELKRELVHIQNRKNTPGTLFAPHRVRYKFKILGKTRDYSLTTGRFAASKCKLCHSWKPKGKQRHLFIMKHPSVGAVSIIAHPSVIEVCQRDHHHILAASLEESTQLLSIALSEVAQRFVQEQSWEGVHCELGQPQLVGSPEYALKSRMARTLTDANQTKLQFGNGFDVDKSLEAKYNDKDHAEIETKDVDIAEIIDRGLQFSAVAEQKIPELIRNEMRNVAESIININKKIENIDSKYNSVAAACQSGLPLQNSYNQLQLIVAQQGVTIGELQKMMLIMTENVTKLIEHIGEIK